MDAKTFDEVIEGLQILKEYEDDFGVCVRLGYIEAGPKRINVHSYKDRQRLAELGWNAYEDDERYVKFLE
jgi:hypothetical protein